MFVFARSPGHSFPSLLSRRSLPSTCPQSLAVSAGDERPRAVASCLWWCRSGGGQRDPAKRLWIIRLRVSGKAVDLEELVRGARPLQHPCEGEVPGRGGHGTLVVGQLDPRYLRERVVLCRGDSSPSSSLIIASMNLTVVSKGWRVSFEETLVSRSPTSSSPMLSIVASSSLMDAGHGLDEEVPHQERVEKNREAVDELERRVSPGCSSSSSRSPRRARPRSRSSAR